MAICVVVVVVVIWYIIQISKSSDVDLSVLPSETETWTNGALVVEISEQEEGYRVTATCNGQPLMTVDYGVTGGQDVIIDVTDTDGWSGPCFG